LLGIDGLDLEKMERILKADIQSVAFENDGKYGYYNQTKEGTNELLPMENVDGKKLRTPREVFDDFVDRINSIKCK
jgi:hypothetical protein